MTRMYPKTGNQLHSIPEKWIVHNKARRIWPRPPIQKRHTQFCCQVGLYHVSQSTTNRRSSTSMNASAMMITTSHLASFHYNTRTLPKYNELIQLYYFKNSKTTVATPKPPIVGARQRAQINLPQRKDSSTTVTTKKNDRLVSWDTMSPW